MTRRYIIHATYELEEWWGADDAYEAGGEDAVLELFKDDPTELLQHIRLEVREEA